MAPRARWTRVASDLAPLLFAVPVLVGIAVTLVRALAASHPDLNFTTAVNSDAEAFYLGETIYRDPVDGFTGQLYTPLFPFAVGLLHHVKLWPGWPILVNFAASLALVGLTARLAYRPEATGRLGRLLAAAGALGMGALAWWLVSVLPLNLLYDGRSDHSAWWLALLGLVLLARDPSGSRRTLVVALVLLSAAFWAKQTTAVAAGAAIVWLLAASALGAVGFRRALVVCLGLVAGNVAILGVLNLLTGGWEYHFDFALAREHEKFATFGPSVREFLRFTVPALALPAVLAAVLAWDARACLFRATGLRDTVIRALRGSRDARLASLLVLFVLIGIPASISFRLKVGSDVNQYIGVAWAGGMLAALAYGRARAGRTSALLAAGAVAVLFLAAARPGDSTAGVRLAPLKLERSYAEVPSEWLRYARTHLVYEQVQSDLNVQPQRSIYPNFYNFIDLLAAGEQPKYLVRALLDRRFDAVAPFRFATPQIALFWEIYASGGGKREANYFWKLNQVIRAGYGRAAGVPAGFLGRRPGPSRAPWMRDCFGPFRRGGAELGIRAGGGFWCRGPGGTLTLRGTPAARSEIHALDPVSRVAGTLGVTLPRGRGAFSIALRGEGGRRWALTGRSSTGELTVAASADGRPVGEVVVRGPRATLAFTGSGAPRTAFLGVRGDRVQAVLPDVGAGDLSFTGSRDSGLRLHFGRASLAG